MPFGPAEDDVLDDGFAGSGPGSAFGAGRGAAFGAPAYGYAPPPPSQLQRAERLLALVMHASVTGNERVGETAVSQLMEGSPGWRRTVEKVFTTALLKLLEHVWEIGWQPADLLRVSSKQYSAAGQRIVRAGIAAQLSGYDELTIDGRWLDQLDEADVKVWWPGELSVVQACAQHHPEGWPGFVLSFTETLASLSLLPTLAVLGPLPGKAPPHLSRARTKVDDRILSRVRALLAKAESTQYPAEAETFTAGAQALMARHSIDHALLAASGQVADDAPTGRRLGIDAPYEAPKVALLDGIASANRCRTIWSKNLGFVTVIGFPSDLDTVELLFTSLLVQATTAMTGEGSRTNSWGGSRTRSFRQSFLLSYAHRIRERLTETVQTQTDEAAAQPGGQNLLPVLASRNDAVRDKLTAIFPDVTYSSVGSVNDGEGWAKGRAAADQARLNPAERLEG